MRTSQNHLRTLHTEASRQHAHWEKRHRKRVSMRKGILVTISLLALATAGTSTAGMPAGATALAVVLLVAVMLNLALTDTLYEREVQALNDAWRRHRADAAHLLARDRMRRPTDTAEKIEHETVDLGARIALTRSESLLHGGEAQEPN